MTDIEQQIERNLKYGDSDAKILAFFQQNGLPYNFNKYERRYESGLPKSEDVDSKGVKSVVIINIYVNDNGSFKSAEIKKIYTYL
jgi:hypothetical protein